MNPRGIRLEALDERVAQDTGIRPGDRILRVNGHPVEDELDYRFHMTGEGAEVEVQKGESGGRRHLQLSREALLGLGFVPMRSRRCRNRCLFCFVDQMPDGLRPSLYVKDEDYRFSFLHGNYVTLASIRDEELERICRLRLQPLYVSVHATDQRVRNFLLGRKKSRNVMEALRVMAEAGIHVHTQVVLCPGINDGSVLEKTVLDLAGLHPAVSSIAIVPVGLTRYRESKGLWPISRVRKEEAVIIIRQISRLQEQFKLKYNNSLVFLADEFYRRAGHPFPPAEAYGDFFQWENGVGMVPLFHRQWGRRRRKRLIRRTGNSPAFLAITGELAYPCLLPYVQWLRDASGIDLQLLAVQNRFFGRSVNVAGLITGRDVIGQMRPHVRGGSILLLPDVMLSRDENRFLDDLKLAEMEEALSVPVEKFKPDPAGFERVLRKYIKGL